MAYRSFRAGAAAAGLVAILQSSLAGAASTSAALAIDRRDGERYGWAIDQQSSSAARERAMLECGRTGAKCDVVLEFSGGCGAYAVERGNGSLYGWATADRREQAESRALEEARKRGGKDVLIRVWGCNSGPLKTSAAATEPANPDGGIWFVYAQRNTINGTDKKFCFVSNAFYVPGVAERSGENWSFSGNAGARLQPYVARFDRAVKAQIPNAEASLEGGWKGGNELLLSSTFPNQSAARRKAALTEGVAAIMEDCANRGYTLVKVSL